MVRPAGSFFSRSASFAVVGFASLRRESWIWMVPVEELHLAPLASEDCWGASFKGTPSRAPLPASVTIFQPTFSCFRFAVSESTMRSCGLSTPVALPPFDFWYSLIAATMRSLTSPVMAPLYSPTQARSDWIAWRSACAIAVAVSAGVCSAGRVRAGVDRLAFGLRHRVRGIGGALQRGTDRDGRDRLRLGARCGRRRHLRLRGSPRGHEYQCCRQHRSHEKSRGH